MGETQKTFDKAVERGVELLGSDLESYKVKDGSADILTPKPLFDED